MIIILNLNGIILKQKTALDYAIDGAKLFGKIDLKRDYDYKMDFIINEN